jgi:hypothetical protein
MTISPPTAGASGPPGPPSADHLTRAQVIELQKKLKADHLYDGRIDGIRGPLTRAGERKAREIARKTGKPTGKPTDWLPRLPPVHVASAGEPFIPAPRHEDAKGPPARTIDAADDAALAQLRRGSPNDQQLANEIARARKSYPQAMANGKIYVSLSPGNGGRPIVTFVPSQLVKDPNQPFHTVVHYHGFDSTAASPNAGAHADERISAQMKGPPLTVFVLPEANNFVKGSNAGYRPDWSNAKNSRQTADDGLEAAGLNPRASGNLTVSGHSAGGRAIRHMAQTGGLSCDHLQLEDSLYGDWADSIKQWGRTAAGKACSHVTYIRSAEGQNTGSISPADFSSARVDRISVRHHYDADFFAPPTTGVRTRAPPPPGRS